MNRGMCLLFISVITLNAFNSYAEDNMEALNSYPAYIQGFSSLNENMKIIKLTNHYNVEHYIVFNENHYSLNPTLKDKIIFNNKIAEIDFYKLLELTGSEYVTKCKSNEIKISVSNSGVLPPLDDLEILFNDKKQSVTGASFCLLYPDIFYSFYIERGHSFSEPGYIKKFKLDNKKISEVMQPYYKLDFETKANANIKIYPAQEEINGGEVGTIGKNSIIQVLGYKADAGHKWYLLEGKSGIIGWHNLYRISAEIISDNPAWEITQETYSLSFMDKIYGPEG